MAVAVGSVCPNASAEVRTPRTVLTIFWGSESAPAAERQDAAIRNFLLTQTDVPVDYFSEYLETEEFPTETASIALRDYIRLKFEGRHIDVVIAVASAALQFAIRNREELFSGVPIVFAATAPSRAIVDRTEPGITGVLNDTPFSETLELALNLHPSAKRVFVVANAPSVDGYDERIRSALSRFSNRVELTYIKERTLPRLLAAVSAIPPQSLIFYARYTPDEPAPNVYPEGVASLIGDVAPVPIYGVSEFYLGGGVVGGMMRTNEALGARLAQTALQILEGTPPENIPIVAVPTAPVFDWRQLQRWGIDTSQIPPGSKILYRTLTVWEAYRAYVIGAILVVAAQLLLITGLLTHRARRRRAEKTILAREASLQTSYDRIQQLAGRLINAQEAARASLAQDLHDDICQRLAMVTTTIDRLRTSSREIEDNATQHAFTDLKRDTRKAFEAVKQLSHDLHPATLRVLGLAPALKNHCTEMAMRHDVEVTFTAESDWPHVPSDVAICFFRVAQESLRNGVVHGAARRLAVSLARVGNDIQMTVDDDGCGFNPDTVSVDGSGVGVVGMEERARVIGGKLHISTGVQHGTTIRIRVPQRAVERATAVR
jgi:signal transduction histidine kinase